VAGHLAHGDRVAGDQADQPSPGPVLGLRVERQRVVEVEPEEPHQAGTALRPLDQGAEFLICTARRERTEQLGDIGLADTTEDPIQDTGERPVSIKDMAVHRHVEHSFGCHGLLPSLLLAGGRASARSSGQVTVSMLARSRGCGVYVIWLQS
jgi:hypothetical protein